MSYRILIVEDEPGMIELLTVALEDEGFNISIANNGAQGLKKVEEEDPDLIISDVMMPDMNGYDFCQQLRSNPKTAAIPFIFLTAKKDVSDRVRGLNLGADDYISKPFHVVEVVARIKTLMQRVKRSRPQQPAPPPPQTQEADAAFSGDLEKMSIGEVVQTIALTRKNGCLVLSNAGRKGKVYFQEGMVTYAEVERKKGTEAVYRLLSWKNGQFKFDAGAAAETQNVQKSAESLLMEGMRRLDEYNRLLDYFPSTETKLEALTITEGDLSPEELQVLNYVNQYSTVWEVIEHSKFGDLKTLQILVKLHSSNIIGIKSGDSDKKPEKMDFDQLAEDLFG
jgi:DNA-binding response OmpR family regulator